MIKNLIFMFIFFTGCSTVNTDTDEILQENDQLKNEVGNLKATLRKKIEINQEMVPVALMFLPREIKINLSLHEVDMKDSKNNFNAKMMAIEDVKKGHFNVFTGGLSYFQAKNSIKLWEKYQIRIIHISSCEDGAALFEFMDAYNEVSKEAIEQKFGKSIVELYDEVK